MTELQLQAKCFQWLWNEYPSERLMYHNNDNNSFNSIEGARKKALGVVAGVSDAEWADYSGKTWYIEFKLPGEKQSKEQKEFQEKLRDRDHFYMIVYTFEQFKNFVISVLYVRE